jgi:hypothetical protein
MTRILSLLLVVAILCLSGCSITYKRRLIKEADIGQSEVFEYGLLGFPGSDSDSPGGLLPLFRSETPLVN